MGNDYKRGWSGYFSDFWKGLRDFKDSVLSYFVSQDHINSRISDDYIRTTEPYNAKASALSELKSICSVLRKDYSELATENEKLRQENEDMQDQVASLENRVSYLHSDLLAAEKEKKTLKQEAGKLYTKVYGVLDKYVKLVESHRLKSQIEIPELDELFSTPLGREQALEYLEALNEAKNNLILMLKKSRFEKEREFNVLEKTFEDYKKEVIKQLGSMVPKEYMISILENVNDSFLILCRFGNGWHVEYVSNATKGILGCDETGFKHYNSRSFSRWFAKDEQYAEFQSTINEGKESFGPLSFTIKEYVKSARSNKIADANFVAIRNNKNATTGYIVLLDKAKFIARMTAKVKGILQPKGTEKDLGLEGLPGTTN